MKSDDRFGDYLLFRELGSSPLGSTYRAGRLQARAVDRVVRLQRFDGDEVDRRRLAADAEGRAAVLERLTAPRFGGCLDQGIEDGIPYAAYDYLLGRTLQEVFSRAAYVATPLETSYLVALIEQAAASLLAAARIYVEGLSVRHGFLVPELLLLSAEGRVYPLGFSHGPALRRQRALARCFAPYLAPGAHGNGDGDDVYSLAAILFEGLTGSPPDPGSGTAIQVDRALLATTGAPPPPALHHLLESGLAPEGLRSDLRSFHRDLRRLVDEAEDSPSQFQIAFFLHQLFRDELEAEAVEMREEKTTRFDPLALTRAPVSAPATSIVPAPVPTIPPAPPVVGDLQLLRQPFFFGLALGLALATLIAGLFQLTRGTPAAPVDEPVARVSHRAGPETEAELRRLVAAGAADLHGKLEDEYAPRLARLRRDVLAAQAARQRAAAANR